MSSISESDKLKAVEKIVRHSHSAFFVTESADGLHGRPMATAKAEDGLKAIWFASQKNTSKIAELKNDSKVLLGYVNGTGAEWASISGSARVVNDRAKIKELWSPIWNNWFDGPDDPDMVLIQVTPHGAEYWDSGSAAVVMLKLAYGALTGHRPNPGVNERVSI